MAAPLVAGGAAVVRDFYQKSRGHQASAALVKAVLDQLRRRSARREQRRRSRQRESDSQHSRRVGPRRSRQRDRCQRCVLRRERPRSRPGTTASHTFDVTSPGVPLKVTLAWTDYPASTSAATDLVNDLDLTVTAPDGTIYSGNVFSGGWSVAGRRRRSPEQRRERLRVRRRRRHLDDRRQRLQRAAAVRSHLRWSSIRRAGRSGLADGARHGR